jgi:hypothetical protein
MTETSREFADDLVRLLTHVAGGSAKVSVDGAPFVELDGIGRNVTVRMGPLFGGGVGLRDLMRESHVRIWEARGLPSALARSGWHVSFQDGPGELVGLGRDVSALTGHVHVSARALWKLGRVL